MSQAVKSTALFERRKKRVRYALKHKGNGRIRLSVFRSGKHIYAQLIDDAQSQTLASASSQDESVKGKVKSTSTIEAAKSVGELIAGKAKQANVTQVVFDRGGYLYHGRVKALAEAARAHGLVF